MVTKELTPKQEAFCQAFLKLGDKSAAYRSAYNALNMKPETVHVKANELYNYGKVRVRIKELQQEAEERNKVELDEIISTLAKMLRFDIADLYDYNGRLKDLQDMPKEARLMIQSIDTEEIVIGKGEERKTIGHCKKVRLMNRLDVIEKLMKHRGGYEKDNNQSSGNMQPIVINLGSGVDPEEDNKLLKLGNK